MNRKIVIGGTLLTSVMLLAMLPDHEPDAVYTEADYHRSREEFRHPPVDSSIIFPNGVVCEGCHGRDPMGFAMVNENGDDVNVYDDWSSTMMANSAKDPFWRAKVSHEILTNPSHSLELQSKCTSCHAPQGHFTAILRGAEHYTLDEMRADTTALDGVSCASCHMISSEDLGVEFSGNVTYDTSRVIFGPYPDPFFGPMNDFVGFEVRYSPHINDAGVCASCHTLVTETVDLDGNPTGDEFVEQATYHEWLNSSFSDPKRVVTCQDCHMPRIDDEVIISANYLFLEGRTPFGMHDLVGGNATMLRMMRDNRDSLGIAASVEAFNETIEKTLHMLQKQSVEMQIELEDMVGDTAYIALTIRNTTGHKFPSGYPSRRAVVQFVASTTAGDTVFASGMMDEQYAVISEEEDPVPHYNVIFREDQAQIYEMVMGDVNGNFTTVLERAHTSLKDNRIPPEGFRKDHISYDTIRIAGAALEDPDFNVEDGIEGSGKDVIHFHVPLQEVPDLLNVSARLYYQSLPPKWLSPMLAQKTPEIDTFRHMYERADLTPVLVREARLDSIETGTTTSVDMNRDNISVFPNPSNGMVFISLPQGESLEESLVIDTRGQIIGRGNRIRMELPETAGLYFLLLRTDRMTHTVRVVRQ